MYSETKRILRQVRGQAEWKMGRVHVGTSKREVVKIFFDLTKDNPEFTRNVRRIVYLKALNCHRKNQGLYRFVTRGR